MRRLVILPLLALAIAAACSDDNGGGLGDAKGDSGELPASAGPATDADLPTSIAPPPAGNGVPSSSASVAGAPGAVDLAAQGYVEEEFIVSGTANVYRYGADGAVEVDREGVPYATRILIRRPQSPRRFSGNVHVETSHPQYGFNVVWSQTFDYLLANGDAYVSITTRRTNNGSSAIEGLEAFDPVRYAPLDFTEDGLNWDIIGQVGRLLKTETPGNPLRDFDVERLYASGWSGGGALLLLYISDGFHDRARMPDGAPIFDGYLVGEPSPYPRINSTATSSVSPAHTRASTRRQPSSRRATNVNRSSRATSRPSRCTPTHKRSTGVGSTATGRTTATGSTRSPVVPTETSGRSEASATWAAPTRSAGSRCITSSSRPWNASMPGQRTTRPHRARSGSRSPGTAR